MKLFGTLNIFIILFLSTINTVGQSLITFDDQGWNSDQSLPLNFSIGNFSFSSDKNFYTNYGYNLDVNNTGIYFVFQDSVADQITITTFNNELVKLNSIAAYQVSEASTDNLIVEGWNGANKIYSQTFSNITSWQILTLNYDNINKIILKLGNAGYIGLTDFNFDDFSFDNASIHGSYVRTKIKVFLQGAYNGNSMNTDLANAGVIPLQQPYNKSPWNYNGTENVTNIPAGTVDWLLLELRTGTDPTTLIDRSAGFLKSDGRVFDTDGTEGVKFDNMTHGNYYLVVRHRNHLAIMSSNLIFLSEATQQYDFTSSLSNSYGQDVVADLGNGVYGMYAGDGDANGVINVLDYGTVANNIFSKGYLQADLNLNQLVNVLDYGNIYVSMFKSSKVPAGSGSLNLKNVDKTY
jgi:hypothetical protein